MAPHTLTCLHLDVVILGLLLWGETTLADPAAPWTTPPGPPGEGAGGGGQHTAVPECPGGCVCAGAGVHDRTDAVSCHFPFLHYGIDLRCSRSASVHMLTVTCDSDLVLSRVAEGLFTHLPHLTTLQVSGCRLQQLDNHIFQGLHNLSRLLINNADLQDITDRRWMDNLRGLQHLDLSINNIRNIPLDLFCGTSLRFINLTANGLWNTSYLGLKPKDESKPCIESLVSLDISYNYIDHFDLQIAKYFPNLKGILMRFSNIHSLGPLVFKNLTSIREIDLTGNFLTTVSSDTFDVHPNLEILLIAHNKLHTIDIDFSLTFPSIKMINLRENMLTGISNKTASLQDGPLEQIAIANNNIEELDRDFFQYIPVKNIQVLSVSVNRIKHVANGAFKNFSSLTHLYMKINNITYIEDGTFEGITTLKHLDLARNKISFISRDAFRHIPLLKSLDLSENNLPAIPDTVFNLPNIQTIDLRNNYITKINPEFQKFGGTSSQMIRIDRRHSRWVPDWMVLQTFQQFDRRMHSPYSFDKSGLLPTVKSRITSFIKMKLYHAAVNQSASFIDLHLLLLKGKTYMYFEFSRNPVSKPIAIDLGFNRITKVGSKKYNLLKLLPVNRLETNKFSRFNASEVQRLSKTASMSMELLIQGDLRCHCRMSHLKQILSNTLKFDMAQELSKEVCVHDRINQWMYRIGPRGKELLCFADELCSSMECPCCRMTECPCTKPCPVGCTCLTDHLQTLTIVDCTGAGLRSIPVDIPHHINYLSLDGNDIETLPSYSFSRFSQLVSLFLNSSQLRLIEKDSFKGLSMLKKISLKDNHIQSLHNWTFSHLVSLDYLDIGYNGITSIDSKTFDNLSKLRKLYLHGNYLERIDLGQLNYPQLGYISLRNNPWTCNCEFGWRFKNWLLKQRNRVLQIYSVTCLKGNLSLSSVPVSENSKVDPNNTEPRVYWEKLKAPRTSEKAQPYLSPYSLVSVITVNFTFCEVNIEQRLISAVSTLGVFLFLLCTVPVLVYRSRQILMVQFFSFCPRSIRKLLRPTTNTEKDFDVFIAYSPQDWNIVFREMLPELEDPNHFLKVCTDYFNWPAGKVTTNNIITSVENSRHTLLVLSKNFLKHEWCTYSFQVAHHQSLKDFDHRVLVVLMPDIDIKTEKLSPDLKLYLRTRICFKWLDPHFWRRLRFAIPSRRQNKLEKGDGAKKDPVLLDVPDCLL